MTEPIMAVICNINIRAVKNIVTESIMKMIWQYYNSCSINKKLTDSILELIVQYNILAVMNAVSGSVTHVEILS